MLPMCDNEGQLDSLFAFLITEQCSTILVFKDLVLMLICTLPQGQLMRYMTPEVVQEILPPILCSFPVTGWKKEMHVVVCWH